MALQSLPPDSPFPDPLDDPADVSAVPVPLSTPWQRTLTAFEKTVKVINAGDPPDAIARATLDLRIAAVDLDRTVMSRADGEVDEPGEQADPVDPLPAVADVAEVLVAPGPVEQWSDTQLLLGAAHRLAAYATAHSANAPLADRDLTMLLQAARTVIASTEPLAPPGAEQG